MTLSIIKTHAYRSGPIGPDGQPRCSDCLAGSDHAAHIAFAKAGPFASPAQLAYARRVVDLEDEGLTTSDAQGAADAELLDRLSTLQAEARAEGIDLSELHRALYGDRAPATAR